MVNALIIMALIHKGSIGQKTAGKNYHCFHLITIVSNDIANWRDNKEQIITQTEECAKRMCNIS